MLTDAGRFPVLPALFDECFNGERALVLEARPLSPPLPLPSPSHTPPTGLAVLPLVRVLVMAPVLGSWWRVVLVLLRALLGMVGAD